MQLNFALAMPLFDFVCRACSHRFEALVRKDPPRCPSCGSLDLDRLLSVPAVTSPERRQAAAGKQMKKAATTARADNAAWDREFDRHRREDH